MMMTDGRQGRNSLIGTMLAVLHSAVLISSKTSSGLFAFGCKLLEQKSNSDYFICQNLMVK